MRKAPPIERFWRFVDKGGPNTCWLWQGGKVRGYGQFAVAHGDRWYAHRYSWTLERGPIPEGLTVDHLCRVTSCVNPAHIELVTGSENTRRAGQSRRGSDDTCRRGHPRIAENLYTPPGSPYQDCRPCQAESRARYEASGRRRRGRAA